MLVTSGKLDRAVDYVERQIQTKNLEVLKRLNDIDHVLNGEVYLMGHREVQKEGLIETVKKQATEIEKLKAIVAELCDYIYKDT